MKPEDIKFESPAPAENSIPLTIAALEYFLSLDLKKTPLNQWQETGWERAKWFNGLSKTPLPEINLREWFDIVIEKLLKESGRDEEKEIYEEFKTQKTKATHTLANYLVKKYHTVTTGEAVRELYAYENGFYSRAENEIIFPEVKRILGDQFTKNAKSETFEKIISTNYYSRFVFTSAPTNLIPLKNGVYDMTTKSLLPHSPEYRFRYQFPVIYDRDATCPKTQAFMGQILTPEQITV